jgi:RND family efflux transporter MFP subunit
LPKRLTRRLALPVPGRLLATAGLLCAAGLFAAGSAAAQGGARAGAAPPAQPVVVSKVRAVSESPTGEYTGLIQSANKVLLSAEVAGRLERLLKKQGDPVAKNEVVAELENPSLEDDLALREAHLKETEAQTRLAETQQERIESLYRNKLVSAQQYQDGQLNLAVAKARLHSDRVQVERLKEQLQRMVIRSPIKGQVISSNLEVGQWITPNQPIFEIFNFDEYEVLVGMPGRLLPTVPESGPVQVRVPEYGVTLTGSVLAAVRHVDSSSGNFTLRVRVVNRGGLPLSGLVARVRMPLAEAGPILTVPRDAIVRRGDLTHVVVVGEDSTAQIVPVQVQGNFGAAVIVSGKGLADGMPVVVRGNERLFPGTAVRIAETLADPPAGKL